MLTEEEWTVLERVAPREAWKNEPHLCVGNQAACYTLLVERKDGNVQWVLRKWAVFGRTGGATGQCLYTLTRSQGWLELTAGETSFDKLDKAFKALDCAEEAFNRAYYG